jgi:hypothetical protein
MLWIRQRGLSFDAGFLCLVIYRFSLCQYFLSSILIKSILFAMSLLGVADLNTVQ